MSQWSAAKAQRVLAALLRIGWRVKRQTGSHRTLQRPGSPDYVSHFMMDMRSARACLRELQNTQVCAPKIFDLAASGAGARRYICRRDVDEPQLYPLLALPAIDRQRSCGVHRATAVLRKRDAEWLAGGAECNRIDSRAVAAAHENPLAARVTHRPAEIHAWNRAAGT